MKSRDDSTKSTGCFDEVVGHVNEVAGCSNGVAGHVNEVVGCFGEFNGMF